MYRSLFGVIRAAIFDTLAEMVIVKKPCGMNWDYKTDGKKRDSMSSQHSTVLNSRASGTVTHSPQNLPRKGISQPITKLVLIRNWSKYEIGLNLKLV